MALPLKHLCNAIRAGEYDHRLDDIASTVFHVAQERMEKVSLYRASVMQPGEDVRINPKANVKPHYFRGRLGKIRDVDGDTVWINLTDPIRRTDKVYTSIGVKAYHVERL